MVGGAGRVGVLRKIPVGLRLSLIPSVSKRSLMGEHCGAWKLESAWLLDVKACLRMIGEM